MGPGRDLVGGRHLKLVCPQLIDVGTCSGLWFIPEAELEEHLVSPGQQHLAALLSELQILLWVWWSGHDIQEALPPPPWSVSHGLMVEAAPSSTQLDQNQ